MSLFNEFGFSLDVLTPAAGYIVIFILNTAFTEVSGAQMKETDLKCAVFLHRHSAMTRFISCPGVFEQNYKKTDCSQLNDDFVRP